MEPKRWFEVGAAEAGLRLDAVVARALGLSRGWVHKLLDAQRVLIAGRPAAKGAILRAGDRIDVLPFARPEAGPIANPAAPLAILCERAGLIAIDKPAGMPVHPLDPDEQDTVLNALVALHPELVGVGEGGLRSGAPPRSRHVRRARLRPPGRRLARSAHGVFGEARREALRSARARRVRR